MAGQPIEVRCFCRREPLLALAGRDARTGEPFVHIKAFRQDRIFVEAVVTAGTVRIRCRECFRWLTVTIRHEKVDVKEEPLPDTVDLARPKSGRFPRK